MKLSDIEGERSFDVIADILDPIFVITQDEEAMGLFQRGQRPEGETREQYSMEWLRKLCNVMLKKHKKECVAILAAIEGVSPKTYTKNLNPVKLFSDVGELMSDEAFRAFFFSPTAQKTETSSGSVSENTKAPEK